MSASPPLATASSSRPAPSPGRTVALPPTSFGQFASDDRDMDLSCAGVVFLESAMDANGVDDNRASPLRVSGSCPSMDVIATFGNCDDDRTFDTYETTIMTTGAQNSSTPLYHSSLYVDLDVERKTVVVQQLVNLGHLTVKSLRVMATLHEGVSALTSDKGKKSAADMKAEFLGHLCSDACLISSEHAIVAGLTAPPLSEYKFLLSARVLGLRLNSTRASLKRKRVEDSGGAKSRKRARASAGSTVLPLRPADEHHLEQSFSDERDDTRSEPYCILSQSEKADIISEYVTATSNEALMRLECSFCGTRQPMADVHRICCAQLDISLLEAAGSVLRDKCNQPHIGIYKPETITDERYVLCSLCRREVKSVRRAQAAAPSYSFVKIPLRSYANGTWTGACPEELKSLTFLEEQCIARCRATRCMFKLELGPTGQYASRGNVCILPQDPGPLLRNLPPPLSALHDEICIILVGSPDTPITASMLKNTPLLVRRSKIVNALLWLIENNPLYADLNPDAVRASASEYPDSGVPFPVAEFFRLPLSSEGSSYTQQANDQQFANVQASGMPSCTVVDVDSIDYTYKQRKLDALQVLKKTDTTYGQRKSAAVDLLQRQDHPYVKFPSGSRPLSTRDNPLVYGYLWPTLFPYGVGMMENRTIALNQDVDFRKLDLKPHVAHLLQSGSDRRFQTHLSFIFVLGNLMQRRRSGFKTNLSVQLPWFPKVSQLYQQVTEETISYQQKLKKNPFAKAETDGEKAAAELMQYVTYLADDIPGSTGEIQKMRHEMTSITSCEGIPHVFLTLNPADTKNPIAQVLAGREIDLDKLFHDLKPGSEPTERAKFISFNPVAAAEFFHSSVRLLIDILLGIGRPNGIGIFGKVSVYYGVVEAQGRGSLHIHLLIWLHHRLSPLELQERLNDPVFKEKVFKWYEDVFCHDVPPNTIPYEKVDGQYEGQPVMCRPTVQAHSGDRSYDFDQDVRDVIENTAQIHSHGDTCFKYLPKTLRNLKDNDKDCRFRLPRDTVEETHIDEDGDIVLKCNNGSVNPYNPIIVATQRCNMDVKPIGSGTHAMAMFQYVGNYTIKGAMDTAFVFSALCAAIKAISDRPPKTPEGEIDQVERSRLLMVKTVNQLIGKRELSAQQMVTSLLGWPSRYTNRSYPVFYWGRMLRDLVPLVFSRPLPRTEPEPAEGDSENPDVPVEGDSEDEDSDDLILLTHAVLGEANAVGDDSKLKKSPLFNDIFHRPPVLQTTCAWDLFVHYEKCALPKSKNSYKEFLRFAPGHPQYTSHCMKKLTSTELPRVPVLAGIPIPRSDKEDQKESYHIAMLALFRPWSDSEVSPLKPEGCEWDTAFDEMHATLSPTHRQILSNMQLLYQSRDAKHDYSALRRQRMAELARSNVLSSSRREDDTDTYDPAWENAMQTEVDGAGVHGEDFASTVSLDTRLLHCAAKSAGFYRVSEVLPHVPAGVNSLAGNDDALIAEQSARALQMRRSEFISARCQGESSNTGVNPHRKVTDFVPLPHLTSHAKELELAARLRQQYGCKDLDGTSQFTALSEWQKAAVYLVRKHALNSKQTLAFLLLADQVATQHRSHEQLRPLRLLVTGPGGTGKSRIFDAWTEFHAVLKQSGSFRLTAPTGVVASDIGGSTTHSEVSLCVKRKNMKATTPQGQKIRSALEDRLAGVRTLVVDEVYFLSASDISILTEYCSIAKGVTEYPFGGLNMVACGDPCQLPPPQAKTLFDRELVNCYRTNTLNAGNEAAQYNIKGIQAWRQFDHVVVLTEIMRQLGDDILIDVLGRLRKGMCTEADKDLLDAYVLSNPGCSQETKDLTSIGLWLEGKGCPLITYCNDARDLHNFEMSKAFAQATGQEVALYHSIDTRGKGKSRRELQGVAAEAAWSVPVKEAEDLPGRVPYVSGMPVFCTDNIATELGLSKGSMGTLVAVKYVTRSNRRYAISAEVDFPGFRNGEDPLHPHRVLLKTSASTVHYSIPGSCTRYAATRNQLPVIPGFAFTSHNSQGRSLEAACIDLASCRSLQSAYVMLSRLRSRKGLCILRPFRLRAIQNHISEELRQELERTAALELNTLALCKTRLDWYYSLYPSDIFDTTD